VLDSITPETLSAVTEALGQPYELKMKLPTSNQHKPKTVTLPQCGRFWLVPHCYFSFLVTLKLASMVKSQHRQQNEGDGFYCCGTYSHRVGDIAAAQ
jgi:hypothetical protein